MFENIINFFKKNKKEPLNTSSKQAAKERLHLVLMQDRANVSVDFLDLMRQEIIEVIKKYIDIDEETMDVRLTNKENEDGTQGAPVLYANIPVVNIKEKTRKLSEKKAKEEETVKQENEENNEENNSEQKPEIDSKSEEVNDENVEKDTENKENKSEEIEQQDAVIEKVIEEIEEIKEQNQEQKENNSEEESENE